MPHHRQLHFLTLPFPTRRSSSRVPPSSMPPASAPPRLDPLFAGLLGRPVLVVGGGPVALRKAEALLAAGASVSVGAPRLVSGLQALAAESRVVHVAGRFQPRWLDPMFLVVAATGDAVVNRAVAEIGRAHV